ncbi:MAG: rhomboid family intramembrane serine protease [Candidatus Rokubacteria bacterium]|nr:rhomboid family intramembrane serine protease [Candidatus Rokubacteria bacterium]MBI3825104.1 rhomboid family intramembrane serine protease [Candidatus Rokubacteria bacterium]
MSDPEERALPITADMLLARRVDFERRMRRFPPVTLGIIAVLVLVYLDESARGMLSSARAIVDAGALDRASVMAGQVWRLFTATLLHGGGDHLFGNAVALYVLGMVCEHAFGRRQFFVLYVLSGLAGSLVSLLVSPGPSVGASGAIFGLQGAAIVLFRQHRDRLLVRDRRIGLVLIVWALYTIATGFGAEYVDNGAHLGGFLGGLLVGRWLHAVVLEPMPEGAARRVQRWFWLVTAVIAGATVAWLGH